jgi:tetratricopeptide (TPR) repeat protein
MSEVAAHLLLFFWFSLLAALAFVTWTILAIAYRRGRRKSKDRAPSWIQSPAIEKIAKSSDLAFYFITLLTLFWLAFTLFAGCFYLHVKHQVLAEKPLPAATFYEAGRAEQDKGNDREAMTDFSTAIDIYSNYPEAYTSRSEAEFRLHDYQRAAADASQAIALDPYFYPAYTSRGFSEYHLTNYPAAMADFTKSVKLNAHDPLVYNQRGLAEMAVAKFTAAQADFTRAILLDPGRAVFYINRGTVEKGAANYPAALQDLNHATLLAPQEVEAYSQRALTELLTTDDAAAITDSVRVIQISPGVWTGYNERGLAEMGEKNYVPALADFNKSVQLNPVETAAWFNCGMAQYHLKNATNAMANFEKAIAINPGNPSLYAALGLVENGLLQFEPALKNFQKALQLDPGRDFSRLQIWLIRARLDDRAAATQDLRQYLNSIPHKKMSVYNAVELYFVGSWSVPDFQKWAAASDSETQKSWLCRMNYYLGMKHLVDGDKVGAMDYFQQCLASDGTGLLEYDDAEFELAALKNEFPP